jgi:hypothetical protein
VIFRPCMFLCIATTMLRCSSSLSFAPCSIAAMEGGSPSCCSEKRSKHNQDRGAAKLSGRTKVAYLCDDTGGSWQVAARARGGWGSSTAAPPPPAAQAFVGMDPVVDAEEEALEHAGRTIVVLVL